MPPDDHFETSMPMMLYRALDILMPRFKTIYRQFDLTEQQWRILRVLWERDSLSVLLLCEQTLIPAPSLVGVIDRLESRGLVMRQRDSADRRKVMVAITAEGRALKEQVTPLIAKAYREAEASATPEVWAQLKDSLQRFSQVQTSGNGAGGIPNG